MDDDTASQELFCSAEENPVKPKIYFEREAVDQFYFDKRYDRQQQEGPGLLKKATNYLGSCCTCSSKRARKIVETKLPVTEWLPRYDWLRDLKWDIISGITVAVMHIPQGLGYAMLANCPPILGIYMAFFPVLIYFFFGTSRHISLGSLSVVTLMCGRVVSMYAPEAVISTPSLNSTTIETIENATEIPFIGGTDQPETMTTFQDIVFLPDNVTSLPQYTPTEVAMAITFLVGVWQLVMHLLQLGILGVLLSDSLVSGFTTAAAVHVFTSQIKYLFGIRIGKFSGRFSIISTWIAIFSNIKHTNISTLVVSVITIGILVVNNEILKPIYSKKLKVPVPIEMIALLCGTLASRWFSLNDEFGIRVVGYIPKGIPEPALPPASLLSSLVMDTLPIAVVAYAVSLSMGKIFAQKHRYIVDSNQELLAQGLANVGGSFFSALPISASLSRSLIQESVGGKTQIASIVSCFLLLMVLLFIGPFFEPLPLAVLASIIVVALKGMFLQFSDLKRALQVSLYDALVWIAAFVSTAFIDIDIGLIIGVLTALFILVLQAYKPHACLLGNVPGTELYLDISKYSQAFDDAEMKIYNWSGGIHFANADSYSKEFYKLVKATKYSSIQYVVLDFTSVSFIDMAGCRAVTTLIKDLIGEKTDVLVVYQKGGVMERLNKCQDLSSMSHVYLFATVADAVTYTKSGLLHNLANGEVNIECR
ncbi:prestin-like isoform X2 [Artemia franciscana]|nr:hypothetical protein QYM36_006998 [Artemia franciscana]KAK2716703.1 hypothetical protein QYM36_006998 [Artemia franciscana]KAK2716704.1 hypothetical protein QYM36_006998 [Artemia franciscana]